MSFVTDYVFLPGSYENENSEAMRTLLAYTIPTSSKTEAKPLLAKIGKPVPDDSADWDGPEAAGDKVFSTSIWVGAWNYFLSVYVLDLLLDLDWPTDDWVLVADHEDGSRRLVYGANQSVASISPWYEPTEVETED